MENVVVISAIRLTSDSKKAATSPDAAKALLKSVQDGDFLSVEFRIKTKRAGSDDLTNLSNRLKGHEKAVSFGEYRETVTFMNFTKLSLVDAGLTVGTEMKGYGISVDYSFIYNTPRATDENGNCVVEPLTTGESNKLLYYKDPNLGILAPLVRQTTLVKGESDLKTPPAYTTQTPYFGGEKKGADGKKTQAYQNYLNAMYMHFSQYAPETELFGELPDFEETAEPVLQFQTV